MKTFTGRPHRFLPHQTQPKSEQNLSQRKCKFGPDNDDGELMHRQLSMKMNGCCHHTRRGTATSSGRPAGRARHHSESVVQKRQKWNFLSFFQRIMTQSMPFHFACETWSTAKTKFWHRKTITDKSLPFYSGVFHSQLRILNPQTKIPCFFRGGGGIGFF